MNERYDYCIIGAGILGLATARALLQKSPDARVVVLDKEATIAAHQTGHNSGVIHRGIYYKPGSLKAALCVRGAQQMIDYCAAHNIPMQAVGKVIVATNPDELPRLNLLYERAIANGVPGVVHIDRARLQDIEPHAAGIAAIHSPQTSIVDYKQVAAALCAEIQAQGGIVRTGAQVTALENRADEMIVRAHADELSARFVINCAGLYADRIAGMSGAKSDVRIVPFRGEYYYLRPESAALVHGLIYPVTDPLLPFLGVHFTRSIHGQVEAGPNAVFALAREGYSWRRLSFLETWQTIRFGGFWRMSEKWWRTGVFEFYRSLSKPAFVRSLQTLVPEIHSEDLKRGGAGVRAQAVNSQGALLDDFYFVQSPHALHVLNAPSPAASASLAIGEYIVRQIPPPTKNRVT